MAKIDQNGRPPAYNVGIMPRPYVDRYRGRTNTRLIRGKIDVLPTYGLEVDLSTNLAVDKHINYPFNWDYNTASQAKCVIPKGHIVSLNSNGKVDFADLDGVGDAQRAYAVGMNFLNLMDVKYDRLAGNRPAIATRGYFELPVFSYSVANTIVTNGYRWGAILASATDGIKPGDLLRICGRTTDPTAALPGGALGWLTNKQTGAAGKLAANAGTGTGLVIGQVVEVDQGPTFEGMLEWVQPEDVWEFEDSNSVTDPNTIYHGSDGTKRVYRDASRNTLFSYDANPYSRYLQDPNLMDAMGIPNLTDGAEWQTWRRDTISLTVRKGDTTAAFETYYYTFWGIGMPLSSNGTARIPTGAGGAAHLFGYDVNASVGAGGVPTQSLAAELASLDAAFAAATISVADDGGGTLTISLGGINTGAWGAGEVRTFNFDLYFLTKGQVAGVPVNIDVTHCIGVARFQLFAR